MIVEGDEPDEQDDPQSFIDAFYDAYERSGLDKMGHVSLHAFGAQVEISHIGIDEPFRGAGNGSKALQLICDIADRYGVTLMASPADDADGEDGLPDKEALGDWYERFGFEHRGQGRMERLPYEVE